MPYKVGTIRLYIYRHSGDRVREKKTDVSIVELCQNALT